MSRQTSAALLLVGNTGSGKTSLLGTLALYVWKKYKKITRLSTFDPGGYGDDVVALISKGIIQVFRGYTRDPEGRLKLALETCSLVTRGYWPKEIDPATGEAAPGCDMVAPAVTKYTMYCPKGHPVRRAAQPQQLVPTPCPTCKTLTSKENCSEIKVEMEMTPGFETVGAYAFDGLTSMSEFSLNDMSHRAALNELGGEKAAINSLVSGGQKYGGTNRAAVGFVQNRAHEWVMNALAIPGQVVPPTFTALELRATDDKTDLPIIGPKIAGNAKTAEVPQWFGNTLGTVIYPGDKGTPEWRLYLREYRMPGEQAPHLCKVRTTPGTMPEFLTDGPDDAPFTQFSLGRFYELCAESLAKASERLADQLGEEAGPALPTGTVGGANAPVASSVPAAAAAPPATALNLDTAPASEVAAAATAAPAATTAPAPPAAGRKAAPPARARAASPTPAAVAVAKPVEAPAPAPASAPAAAPAEAAAPVVPAAGVIPAPQEEVQPPAVETAKPPVPQTVAPTAPPRVVPPAPAAGRVPPPAGARPAPRPPQAAPVAVPRRK